jgi:deferrochelatase/peroxidase EfeB
VNANVTTKAKRGYIAPPDSVDLDDLQGNILRGYTHPMVRHLMLEVGNLVAARNFLAIAADGGSEAVPAITRAGKWETKPPVCFNIGVTYAGLKALRVAGNHLASFPTEFIEGMTRRAAKLGDFGDSAPENWPAPFDRPDRLHLIASVYAHHRPELDHVEAQVARAFTILGVRNGRKLDQGKVFLGYKDGIAQPRFTGIVDPKQTDRTEPEDPLGTVLLGHPTRLENLWFRVPGPVQLGHNGSFNAFRILATDVAGFEKWLDTAATFLAGHPDVEQLLPEGAEKKFGIGVTRHEALREIVAAQMCGRWRDGTPYETSPDAPNRKVSQTDFDYTAASRCPAGAHIRRGNPRGGPVVQRISNFTRRIVRRGMSYNLPDPNDPNDPNDHSTPECGLLGNFIGANIAAQFEAVMCDWINTGLQDPDITGSNDPLLGANVPETSWFDMTLANGGRIRLRGFPRFITTRGGAYAFLPSLTAIRYLARLPD